MHQGPEDAFGGVRSPLARGFVARLSVGTRPAVWAFLVTAAVAGCHSDTSGPQAAPSPNDVRLQSDPGDYIGGGLSYDYTQANAAITVSASGGHLSVNISGDEGWGGSFQMPSTLTQLQPGDYTGLERYPFNDPAKGGLDWSGEGRGCNTLSGWFAIDSVTYDAGDLAAIDLRFEQHCEGMTPALHGTIHWRRDDPTKPPGPITPPPAGLWRPAAGSTPPGGNYVFLVSDAGDWVGAGQTLTYTPANGTITVATNGGHLSVGVADWFGDFQTMNTINRIEAGYYPDLRRYPFHNPIRGGLDWFGQGRGCNTLTGWFVVDRVAYARGTLTGLDLRFEQHCEGGTTALHGAIHWDGT